MFNSFQKIIYIGFLAAVLLFSAGCGQIAETTQIETTTSAETSETETTSETIETLPETASATETLEETTQIETSLEETVPEETTAPREETSTRATTASTTTTAAAETTVPPTPVVSLTIECHKATEAGITGAPDDGIILATVEVDLGDGDTVWDVLFRVGKEEKIAINSIGSGTGLLVTGIKGLAMTGSGTGWIYSVNGEVPGISAGAYKLAPGDEIKWQYTLDSGNDL